MIEISEICAHIYKAKLYAYVGNDPLNATDPPGLQEVFPPELFARPPIEVTPPEEGGVPEYKVPRSGQTGKESSDDVPSWARGQRPYKGENGKDFADRICPDGCKKGPGSDWNKIRKWSDRHFRDPSIPPMMLTPPMGPTPPPGPPDSCPLSNPLCA